MLTTLSEELDDVVNGIILGLILFVLLFTGFLEPSLLFLTKLTGFITTIILISSLTYIGAGYFMVWLIVISLLNFFHFLIIFEFVIYLAVPALLLYLKIGR
jgi:hypothetical protein